MKTIFVAACMLLINLCHAQTKVLDIGDSVPKFQLINLFNQVGTIDSRSLKGKLVILDFWNLRCSSCIAAMPKMDSLQEKFGDKIQIIMVTNDERPKVDRFFKRFPKRLPKTPVVVADTLLHQLFPHQFVPHHVWITEQGLVEYITSGNNTNEETFAAYFAGKKLNFIENLDVSDLDMNIPIWKAADGRVAHRIKYYSALAGYLTEYPYGRFQIKRDGKKITGMKYLNTNLLTLYKVAYGGLNERGVFAKEARISIEVTDSTVFFFKGNQPDFDSWKQENYYSYDAEVMPGNEASLCELLQEDLKKYFPYDVSFEKRGREMVRLKIAGAVSLDDKKGKVWIDSSLGKIHFENVPVSALYKELGYRLLREGLILVEENANATLSHLVLSYPFLEWKIWKDEIAGGGLTISQTNEPIDVMVIKDRPRKLALMQASSPGQPLKLLPH
ncbi:MAG: TlpA disulfide reductase family protein [Chitinophagaceae bacterium]